MAIFKCKMCGGSLELQQGLSIVECPYCSTMQTVPTLDEKLIRLYNRANQYRLDNEFDKAYSAYEAIISEKNDEAEAYWGMVLSEFGVEYVEDPETQKRIPTCHRTLIKSISSNENYKAALKFADIERRMLYEDEAETIDSLQKKILNISAKEDPYDIFICYKETDSEGNRTEDSVIAQEIYENLKGKGYRVFFSRITLEDKLGKDYEPCIYAALTSAKVMLVVTTDTENSNSVWVKNEWKRYIDFMKTDKEKTLIPVYKNMSPYALPDEFAKLQAQDMSKIGAIQDLVRGVEKLIGKTDESKSGLSESEKKLLDAFEKSQERKEFLLKIFGGFAIGAVLLAIVAFILKPLGLAEKIFSLVMFEGSVENIDVSGSKFLMPCIFGMFCYIGTLISMLLDKKMLKYAKYIFAALFVGFSVYIAALGLVAYYIPTELLWIGYALVGVTAVAVTVISAKVNKKFPFLLLVILLTLGGLLVCESRIPRVTNERNTSLDQVVVVNDFINIRSEMSANSDKRGVVNKGDIFTVYRSEIVDGSKWIKIITGQGIDGYIIFGEGGEDYCEYLPIDGELQKEIEARREKEDAIMKEAEEAIKLLDGKWKWQNDDGYYMEIEDGVVSFGTNPEGVPDDETEGFWRENYAFIKYDAENKVYLYNDTGKLTYDGTKLRIYDEFGYPYWEFEGYAIRY